MPNDVNTGSRTRHSCVSRLSWCVGAMFAVAMCASAMSPPPTYIELSSENIAQLGFKYEIWKKGDSSYLKLDFPARIDEEFVPKSTAVTTRSKAGGQQLSRTL